MNKRFLRVLVLGLGWLAIAATVSAILCPLQVPKLQQIEANKRTTAGTIIGKDCQNHAQVTYAFEVDGRTYTGARPMGEICASAIKGQHIDVYYDSLDPTKNTPLNPSSALQNEILSVIVGALFLASFVIWRIAKFWTFGKA